MKRENNKDIQNQTQIVVANQDSTHKLQMLPLEEMKVFYDNFVKFSREILKEGLDYGTIPGVSKPSLLKPGAEKLRLVYGLSVSITLTSKTEDLERKYLDYTYKAVVSKNDQILAECEGNANSYESKWRYVWVATDKKPTKEEAEILKAQKLGKWAKVGNSFVWMERQENSDLLGLKNTIMKMAQKRAFVGAILIATGASEFFTQDVEDMELHGVEDKVEVVSENQNPNKYEKQINALLQANLISEDEYKQAVNDENKSIELIKQVRDRRATQ